MGRYRFHLNGHLTSTTEIDQAAAWLHTRGPSLPAEFIRWITDEHYNPAWFLTGLQVLDASSAAGSDQEVTPAKTKPPRQASADRFLQLRALVAAELAERPEAARIEIDQEGMRFTLRASDLSRSWSSYEFHQPARRTEAGTYLASTTSAVTPHSSGNGFDFSVSSGQEDGSSRHATGSVAPTPEGSVRFHCEGDLIAIDELTVERVGNERFLIDSQGMQGQDWLFLVAGMNAQVVLPSTGKVRLAMLLRGRFERPILRAAAALWPILRFVSGRRLQRDFRKWLTRVDADLDAMEEWRSFLRAIRANGVNGATRES